MKSWKLATVVIMFVTLSGCVSLTPPTAKDTKFHYISQQQRQARISKQNNFVAKGAFSIAEEGKEPVLANYQWQQTGRRVYRIRVASALNLFSLIIVGRPHSVTMWRGNRQTTAPTPELLIKREMGWTLPVRNLFYWIRGITAPGRKKIETDQYGHLIMLQQNGWSIHFSHYTAVTGYDLPQKVVLRRSDILITVVIKQWKI